MCTVINHGRLVNSCQNQVRWHLDLRTLGQFDLVPDLGFEQLVLEAAYAETIGYSYFNSVRLLRGPRWPALA